MKTPNKRVNSSDEILQEIIGLVRAHVPYIGRVFLALSEDLAFLYPAAATLVAMDLLR